MADRTHGAGDLTHLLGQLQKLFEAVRDHARSSPDFARRLEEAIAPPPPPPPELDLEPEPQPEPQREPAPKPKRRKALIDPFAVYETGWESMLRQELGRLSAEQMRDVIAAYELDPNDRSARLKSPAKLGNFIVKAVMNRAEKRS